jgi:hypothetical protein
MTRATDAALRALKGAPGPPPDDYEPRVSVLPGRKAPVLPGQLSFEDDEAEEVGDDAT